MIRIGQSYNIQQRTSGLNTRQLISFGKIPPNFITAEKVVRDIKSRGLRSSTLIKFRFYNLDPEYREKLNLSRMIKILDKYSLNNIGRPYNKKFPAYSDFIRVLKDSVNKSKAANCGEHAYLAQAELLSRGIKADAAAIYLKDIETGKVIRDSDHNFVLINLDPKACIEKPETWGKDAVIVDAWLGIVKRAKEALEFFKTDLNLNNQRGKLVIENKNFNLKNAADELFFDIK